MVNDTNLVTKDTITSDQIKWILSRLSTNDKQIVESKLRECSNTIMLTRSLPLSVFAMTGIYYCRNKLNHKVLMAMRPFPLYFVVGFTSLGLSTFLGMPSCAHEIKGVLSDMYPKYQQESIRSDKPPTTFDEIRRRNRLAAMSNKDLSHDNIINQDTQFPSIITGEDQHREDVHQKRKPLPNYFTDDSPGYMSGTPISTPKNDYQQPITDYGGITNPSSTNRYGDRDFS
uniref:OCIA domain-containing protein n=1 Tax=Parastrongyloides trichosuri TaxID=131310 RepID=A0A0N4Z734_PARTI